MKPPGDKRETSKLSDPEWAAAVLRDAHEWDQLVAPVQAAISKLEQKLGDRDAVVAVITLLLQLYANGQEWSDQSSASVDLALLALDGAMPRKLLYEVMAAAGLPKGGRDRICEARARTKKRRMSVPTRRA